MKVNRENLEKILSIVSAGVASKSIIEQATCFVFKDNSVMSFNDVISISHPLEIDITGVVPSEEFLKILNKLKTEEIDVLQKENEIIILSGKSKVGLTVKKDILLPLEEIGEIGDWKKLPSNFCKCSTFAMHACSSDMSRPILTAINVTKNGFIEGSDSFRIVRTILNKEMPINDFLLPAVAVNEITKLKPTHIAKGDGWIHFKNKDDVVISCRIFEDDYPDVNPHLDVKGIEVQFPKILKEALDRATVFSKRDHFLDEEVLITIKNKQITIRGESEIGWLEEKANIRYSGDEISFRITPYLLQDILKDTNICIIGENLLKFETEEWQYVALIKS